MVWNSSFNKKAVSKFLGQCSCIDIDVTVYMHIYKVILPHGVATWTSCQWTFAHWEIGDHYSLVLTGNRSTWKAPRNPQVNFVWHALAEATLSHKKPADTLLRENPCTLFFFSIVIISFYTLPLCGFAIWWEQHSLSWPNHGSTAVWWWFSSLDWPFRLDNNGFKTNQCNIIMQRTCINVYLTVRATLDNLSQDHEMHASLRIQPCPIISLEFQVTAARRETAVSTAYMQAPLMWNHHTVHM